MQAIFFDLDGTLIESKKIITRLINETLMEFGYKTFTEEEMLASVGMPLESLLSLRAGRDDVERMCKRYIEKYFEEGLKDTKPYDGIINLLKELKDEGAKIGIITTKSEEEAKRVIEHLGFSPYVDVVVGHSKERNPKPNPDPIIKACSILSIPPEKTIMIGDTDVDIKAGKFAGTFATIGVLWGIGKENDLRDADYIAQDINDLKHHLKRIKDHLK